METLICWIAFQQIHVFIILYKVWQRNVGHQAYMGYRASLRNRMKMGHHSVRYILVAGDGCRVQLYLHIYLLLNSCILLTP